MVRKWEAIVGAGGKKAWCFHGRSGFELVSGEAGGCVHHCRCNMHATVEENLAAFDTQLSVECLADVDRVFKRYMGPSLKD